MVLVETTPSHRLPLCPTKKKKKKNAVTIPWLTSAVAEAPMKWVSCLRYLRFFFVRVSIHTLYFWDFDKLALSKSKQKNR